MAYPYRVDPGGQIFINECGLGCGTNHRRRIGPFMRSDGKIYGIFLKMLPEGSNTLQCWASADFGATWSEVDAANNKPAAFVSGQYGFREFDAVAEPTGLIHIVFLHTTQTYAVTTFNPSTDTWGTTHTGGPPRDASGAYRPVAIALRSVGVNTFDRIVAQRFGWSVCGPTGSWSGYTPYPNLQAADPERSLVLVGAVSGPLSGVGINDVHVFLQTSAGARTRHYWISSGNGWNVGNYLSGGGTNGFITSGIPGGAQGGSELFVIFGDAGPLGNRVRVLRAIPPSVGPPGWDAQEVGLLDPVTNGSGLNEKPAITVDANGIPQAFWVADLNSQASAQTQKIYRSRRTAGVWSPPEQIIDTLLPPTFGGGNNVAGVGTISPRPLVAGQGDVGLFADWGRVEFNGTIEKFYPYYWQEAAGAGALYTLGNSTEI